MAAILVCIKQLTPRLLQRQSSGGAPLEAAYAPPGTATVRGVLIFYTLLHALKMYVGGRLIVKR
jgi:hypothetical protein